MSTITIEINPEKYRSILDDYYAPPEKRHKLEQKEVERLASLINSKVNIPFVNDEKEQRIFIKIVTKIDSFLYDHLPNELYDLIHDAHDGIDAEEAKEIIDRLSKAANQKINIPYLPEITEYWVIKLLLGLIVNSMRKHWDFNKAVANAQELIPAKVSRKEIDTLPSLLSMPKPALEEQIQELEDALKNARDQLKNLKP